MQEAFLKHWKPQQASQDLSYHPTRTFSVPALFETGVWKVVSPKAHIKALQSEAKALG
jgi:hypothetical protein